MSQDVTSIQPALFHTVSVAELDGSVQTYCRDCSARVREIGERYVVHDKVWPIEPDGGVLCVGCIEARIGRRLLPEDFTDCAGNRGYWPRSQRLDDRLNPRDTTATGESRRSAR